MTRDPISPLLLAISFLLTTAAFAQDNLRDVPPSDPEYERQRLNVADGFELNLFASDPMIEKPIQMTWDERGRLWVIGSAVYPHLLPGQEADDKIFVLEDTNGDGQADQSTVFADGLLTPTGLLVGDGGAYVANSTEILHLRDLDGDGYAEDRRVVLRGFGADDTHHLIHSFRWGPDGMMYINQSIYIFSHIETPWGVRRLRQGGIWHYRPENQKLDVFARGFVNPWGHSFDAYGQSFVTDGAFYDGINHVFPGATFIAAYRSERTLSGLNPDNPKHSGLAIISGRHMPDSLQGHMIANDFRANRVNRFAISDTEKGYVSAAAGDLIWTDHIAFRPVDATVGPDGALYIADWYNPIIQHGEVDFRDPRRDHVHGRIWRISAKDRPLVEVPDLPSASATELLDMLLLPELWTRTQARRLLKESGAADVMPVLDDWLAKNSDNEYAQLEALWLHQALDIVDEDLLRDVLGADIPQIRAAAVRVLYHWQDRVEDADAMLAKAIEDSHQRVRREAVTALGCRQSAEAARTALSVLDRPMNEYIDFALWHTLRELEPYWSPQLVEDSNYFGEDLKYRVFAWKAIHTPEAVDRLVELYAGRDLPEGEYREVLNLIVQYGDGEDLNMLMGLALKDELYEDVDQEVFLEALVEASTTYGNKPTADTDRIGVLLDDDDVDIRRLATQLIGHWQLEQLAGRLERLVDLSVDEGLRRDALNALANIDEPSVRERLVGLVKESDDTPIRIEAASAFIAVDLENGAPEAMQLLRELPADANVTPIFEAFYDRDGGHALLEELIVQQPIPAKFATAGLESYRGNRLRDRGLLEALEASGGVAPAQHVSASMNSWNIDRIELDAKASGDPARGEIIYRKKELVCINCHAIGGAGGQVGPDLSSIGANAPTDYILESLLIPEKAVKDGYALTRIERDDGQVVMGTLIRDTGSSVQVRDASDAVVTVPANRVVKQEILPGSLMPAGLMASLDREEFIDLVAFLSLLGEDGPYRIPANAFVRRWEIFSPPVSSLESLPSQIEQSNEADWETYFSFVDGSLKFEELSESQDSYVILRFWVENASARPVQFSTNVQEGLHYLENNTLKLATDSNITVELAEGQNPVVLVIDRRKLDVQSLNIEMRSSMESKLIHSFEER